MNDCVIYDFETLGLHQQNSVVVSFALLLFDEKRYLENPYTYEELLSNCNYIKFDVEDQVVNYNRKINKDTLDWWNNQGEEAKKQIRPSSQDVSISQLYQWITKVVDGSSINKTFCRGNTFDTMFLQYIMEQTNNKEPFHWRTTRDTRSMIDGMSFGMNLDNGFTPGDLVPKFVKHDPRHDVAMDVMRMQLLAQAILGK